PGSSQAVPPASSKGSQTASRPPARPAFLFSLSSSPSCTGITPFSHRQPPVATSLESYASAPQSCRSATLGLLRAPARDAIRASRLFLLFRPRWRCQQHRRARQGMRLRGGSRYTEELTSDRMALQLSAAQPTPQTTIIAKSASKPLSSMG